MNHLLRELAPIGDAGWAQIDDEAKTRLTTYLAARRLVDFVGPSGWEYPALNLGRVAAIDGPAVGVEARTRLVQPLVELKVPFTLDRAELSTAARGNDAVDLGPLDKAARLIALTENSVVFHGYPAGGISGIAKEAVHEALPTPASIGEFPRTVAMGVDRLLRAGIGGPYGLALGDDTWVSVAQATERGSTLLDHLSRIAGGPIVWAPGVDGSFVVSQRGGDFVLTCGQDLSIGYLSHDVATVTLYLEESMTFRVLSDDAAVHLAP